MPTVPALARIAAVIHGCRKASRRLPVPATATGRTPVPAVRPKVKPSMRAAIVTATALGKNTPAASIAGKAIVETAAHPAMTTLRTA